MINNNDDMSRIEACKVELEALKTMQDIWSKMYEIGTISKEDFDLNLCELIKDARNIKNDMDCIRRKDN